MTNPLLKVLAFALLPAGAVLAGGGFALWRVPGAKWRSAILHFAAGVIFSVVAVELLPDIVQKHRPFEVALGFGAGVAAMLGIRATTNHFGSEDESTPSAAPEQAPDNEKKPPVLPAGLLFGVAVDLMIDGLLLGIGFAAGQKEGVLLALALTVEVLALGLATSAQLQQDRNTRARVLVVLAGLALSFLLGATGGATLLSNLGGEALELVLSFGLAALLFLVTEELLVEAHEETETPALTAAFFVGFLLFLLLGMSG